jgi:hypothetical protein
LQAESEDLEATGLALLYPARMERLFLAIMDIRARSISFRLGPFIAALLCQHSPGDPRQFVGEGSRQHIGMQALHGANDPSAKTVLWPVRRPH